MIPWLIGLGVALIGGAVVCAFWDEILEWFGKVLKEVAMAIRELGRRLGRGTEYATEAVAKLLDNTSAAIEHHLYYKEHGQWIQETTRSKCPVKELPARLRGKVHTIGEEADVTEEMEIEVGQPI